MVKDPASEIATPEARGTPLTPSRFGAEQGGFFGHPRGLRTLFFTEMWERFSYYGMRAILILFMTAAVVDGGLGFGADKAGPIYAMYTSLVYLATVPGGWLADNFLGQRRSVLYGGIVIMTGHILLAMHGLPTFFAGLGCVVIGTGLLKPNISVIVGQLYSEEDRRRDSGFSIFYMGINLGAFSAPLVCGWLAQSATFKGLLRGWSIDPVNSWHWGFAAAAVGMFFGLLQYLITGRDLGTAGLKPSVAADSPIARRNRRTLGVSVATLVVVVGALIYFDSTARHLDAVTWESAQEGLVVRGTLPGGGEPLALNEGEPIPLGELESVLGEDTAAGLRMAVLREELQAGRAEGRLTDVFLRVPTEEVVTTDGRVLEPSARQTVRIGEVSFSTTPQQALRIVGRPMEQPGREVLLGEVAPEKLEFTGHVKPLKKPIAQAVLKNVVERGGASGVLTSQDVKLGGLNTSNIHSGFTVLLLVTVVGFFLRLFLAGEWTRPERARLVTIFVLFCGAAVFWGIFEQAGSTLTLFADRSTDNAIFGREFPSSWWQSVNAAMIVLLAPLFAWLWLALGKHNPSYPAKFAVGLLFAGLGFAVLVGGATLSRGGVLVSPFWLLLVYLLHTIGELFLSPVGLSSMTKLAPARVVSLMMGVWFLAASVGNFMGGTVSGYYEKFALPTLFGLIAASGVLMALLMFALVVPIKRMMDRSGASAYSGGGH
jgi:dipeptide/tripeptide permease